MALFEFELKKIANIVPWDSADGPTLSWFALTDGTFWMPVGDQVLFEYDDQILKHWEATDRTVDYQIAALARDVLGSMALGLTRLPKRLERLASDWEQLSEFQRRTDNEDGWSEACYTAWRWLGERRPWASYFVAEPYFQFVRIGNLIHVRWDNSDRVIEAPRTFESTNLTSNGRKSKTRSLDSPNAVAYASSRGMVRPVCPTAWA